MLVFDSASLPVRERRGAIVDSVTSATSASFMTPDYGGERLHLHMTRWDLGGVEVFDTQCSAHTLRRSPRRGDGDDESMLAFTWGLKGLGSHRQGDHELALRPSDVWATNLSEPFVHRVSDTWTITAKVPAHLLGVPRDVVAPTLEHVGKSHHMTEVRRVGDEVNAAAAASLGTATVALARALLASVSGDARLGREALEDVLLLRVKAFVREHLADPGLDPEAIAAANHVSLRQLYKTCARAGLRLEQWIIEQRLERAHEELARVSSTGDSVAALAHRWGFSSASHFARRFRATYGLSPREWQAVNRAAQAPTEGAGSPGQD